MEALRSLLSSRSRTEHRQQPAPRPLSPESACISDAVEAVRKANAAVLMQRFARGFLARSECLALACAADLSRRAKLQTVATLPAEVAALQLLQQRRRALTQGLLGNPIAAQGTGHRQRQQLDLLPSPGLAFDELTFRWPSWVTRPIRAIAGPLHRTVGPDSARSERVCDIPSGSSSSTTHLGATPSPPRGSLPEAVIGVKRFVDLLVPDRDSQNVSSADDEHGNANVSTGDHQSNFTRTAAEEHDLCILLVTIGTFRVTPAAIVARLSERYDACSALVRQHVAYITFRWTQIHPWHFAAESKLSVPLQLLWQRCARDGNLSELCPRVVTADSNVENVMTLLAGVTPVGSASGNAPVQVNASWLHSSPGPGPGPGADVWLPFLRNRGPRRVWSMMTREAPLSSLTSTEALQVFACLHAFRVFPGRVRRASLPAMGEAHEAVMEAAAPTGACCAPAGRDARRRSSALRHGHPGPLGSKFPRRASDDTVASSVPRDYDHDSQDGTVKRTRVSSLLPGFLEQLGQAIVRPLPRDSVIADQWLGLEPQQIAKFLTLQDECGYQKVTHTHLLAYVWKVTDFYGKVDDTHPGGHEREPRNPLLAFTLRFNELACIVASAIVTTPRIATRAVLFAHFLAVAAELRSLQNYNSLNAILAGLGSAAVHRLRATIDLMGPVARRAWGALRVLMAPDRSYRSYRAALAVSQQRPPFIPYLGVHLTDLTFLCSGSPDFLSNQGVGENLVGENLAKRQKAHSIIHTCLTGQTRHFSFSALPGIALIFGAASRLTQDAQYKLSLEIEPRGMAFTEM